MDEVASSWRSHITLEDHRMMHITKVAKWVSNMAGVGYMEREELLAFLGYQLS